MPLKGILKLKGFKDMCEPCLHSLGHSMQGSEHAAIIDGTVTIPTLLLSRLATLLSPFHKHTDSFDYTGTFLTP